MNELLAIIIIVIVCCAIFFAWLLSMATCPDKMINWISGTGNSTSTCSTSYNESKELIREDRDNESNAVHSNAPNSGIYLQLNNVARRSNSKKLSVVPEQDEQLTVTSISQVLYPASDRPSKYGNNQSEGAQRLAAHFEIHDDIPLEEVVVVDGTSNVGVEPMETESQVEYTGQGGLRYHYSLPAIHVT